MIEQFKKEAQINMDKAKDALVGELSKLRTGRAHPSLLAQVMVDYYGTPTQLSQVAAINVESARVLTVTPWEKTMIAPIEKAIMTADLGLNPATAGMIIRIPLPPLTEERRKSLTKIVRETTEKSRVRARAVRREFLDHCKAQLKEKEMTEDDMKKAEQIIKKITDQSIKALDEICQEKETELMSV